jgi:hypothetical protein
MIVIVLDTRAAKLLAEVVSGCQRSIVVEPWLALHDKCCRLSVGDMKIETLAQWLYLHSFDLEVLAKECSLRELS